MNKVSLKFSVNTLTKVHLGAIGSVKFRLAKGKPFEVALPTGRNVPALCVNADKNWTVWFASGNPENVRVRFDGNICTVQFGADHSEPLSLKKTTFQKWSEVVAWLRTQLGLDKRLARPTGFKRVYFFDIHDPEDGLIQGFDDVRRGLEDIAKAGYAKDAVLYLPGWDGAYDGTYPDYRASKSAGGWKALEQLNREAADMGAQLLLHLNHWGLSDSRMASYPKLKGAFQKNPDGSFLKWPGSNWKGGSNPLYYLKPDHPELIKVMKARVDEIVARGIRGIFLDQFGAPIGLDSKRVRMAKTYEKNVCGGHPDAVFGSELPMPETVGSFRLSQMWGPAWSGMAEFPVTVSELCADVYDGFVQLFGHLGTPAPYPTRYAYTNYVYLAQYGWQEAFKRAWKQHKDAHVLPTLRLHASKRRENIALIKSLLGKRRAR